MDISSLKSVRYAQYIDVRPKEIFEKSHINNAINIPVEELPTRFREVRTMGQVPVILYCEHGEKSGYAANYLRKQGLDNVYNGGGYNELSHYLKFNSRCSIF